MKNMKNGRSIQRYIQRWEKRKKKPQKKDLKIDGTSLFINLNEDAESEATLRRHMTDSLKEHSNKATFKVMSRKQIGIYFQDIEETKNAENALLGSLKGLAKVTRI